MELTAARSPAGCGPVRRYGWEMQRACPLPLPLPLPLPPSSSLSSSSSHTHTLSPSPHTSTHSFRHTLLHTHILSHTHPPASPLSGVPHCRRSPLTERSPLCPGLSLPLARWQFLARRGAPEPQNHAALLKEVCPLPSPLFPSPRRAPVCPERQLQFPFNWLHIPFNLPSKPASNPPPNGSQRACNLTPIPCSSTNPQASLPFVERSGRGPRYHGQRGNKA